MTSAHDVGVTRERAGSGSGRSDRYGGLMAAVCTQCDKPLGTSAVTTPTGRTLCPSCAESYQGLVAGAMASGGSVGTSASVEGWFRRLTRRRANG